MSSEKENTASFTGQGLAEETLTVMTTGTDLTYIRGCAMAASFASQDDPLTIMFHREKYGAMIASASREAVRQVIYETNIARLTAKISAGSVIAESHNFTAVACWSPPESSLPMTDQEIDVLAADRPIFASFLKQIEKSKQKHLYPSYGDKFWHLSLMGRDPRLAYVPGAVRAVVEPFIQRARVAGVAIWLEAGSQRARDVYAHFGFQLVDEMETGFVKTWCMLLQPLP